MVEEGGPASARTHRLKQQIAAEVRKKLPRNKSLHMRADPLANGADVMNEMIALKQKKHEQLATTNHHRKTMRGQLGAEQSRSKALQNEIRRCGALNNELRESNFETRNLVNRTLQRIAERRELYGEELERLIERRDELAGRVEDERDGLADQRRKVEEMKGVLRDHENHLQECCMGANSICSKL